MSSFKPILEIEKFGLADTVRADKNRIPGMCSILQNTAPSLSGLGERVRRGYAAYTDVTAPTGTEILKVAPIQNPSQEDVHIFFASNSGKKVYMNPWWKPGGTKQTTNLLINEQIAAFVWAGIEAAFTATITGADALGFSSVADYYKNWMVTNSTLSSSGFVLSNTYSSAAAGTIVLTFYERIGVTGLGWVTGNTLALYRNFHDDSTFSPSYNTTLSDPPVLPTPTDSIIRFSGGQSTTTGNRGIRIDPYLNKTFFPFVSGGVAFTGSYASRRQCNALPKAKIIDVTGGAGSAGLELTDTVLELSLEKDRTYWVAVAAVYDGFQIGELAKYETVSDYFDAATHWTGNFLPYVFGVSQGGFIKIRLKIALADLNKRITGFVIYAAQDVGDTTASGRVSPYFEIEHIPIDSIEGWGNRWTSFGNQTKFYLEYFLGALEWNARGNAYVVDAGYIETPTDTMYAYSDEITLGLRHYLTNLYIASASQIDRQNLWTNPIGGNADLNAGVVQPDIFSNEEEIFVLRAEPTVGTKITGMRSTGIEELLVLKDRGLILGRQFTAPSGNPVFAYQIISPDRGCSTLGQIAVSDDQWIYFAGYDDIHRYRQNVLQNLIEDASSQNDWLHTYRETISKASKESCVVWWLSERVVYFDIGQADGRQYAFYPDHGWRQVKFKEVGGAATQFFKWPTRLQSGMRIITTNDATPEIKKFSDPATNVYYYADGSTSIAYEIDTADFIPSGDLAFDTILNFWTLSRTFDLPTIGTLDIDLWKDGVLLRSYAGQNKANAMLRINSLVSDARIGNSWRLHINSNSSPELLNALGSILTLNKILLYGEIRARGKRANELTTGIIGLEIGDGMSNTVSGVKEVIVNSTDTAFVWDTPFTKIYTSGSEGAGQPQYRFEFETPYVVGSDHSTAETVVIVTKSLTGITLRSSSDNTLVKFDAFE